MCSWTGYGCQGHESIWRLEQSVFFFLSNPYVSLKRYLILYGKQNKSESEIKPLRLNDPDSQTSEERREAKEPQTTSDV